MQFQLFKKYLILVRFEIRADTVPIGILHKKYRTDKQNTAQTKQTNVLFKKTLGYDLEYVYVFGLHAPIYLV